MVIGFELKSIGNLFTDANREALGIPGADTARLARFYSDKLRRYCEIVLGHPCTELKGCNIKDNCGDDQLCVNDGSPKGYKCVPNHVELSSAPCRYAN